MNEPTVASLIQATLRRYSTETAIIAEDGRSISFDQLRDRVFRLTNFLIHGLGLKKGDRVAILAENSAEFIELDYAAGLIGIVKVPLYMRNAPHEHLYMLEDTGAIALFIDSHQVEPLFAAMGNDWGPLKSRVVTFRRPYRVPGTRDYEESLAAAAAVRPDHRAVQADDYYHIRYTGGTTGRPKGAATSQRAMLHATLGNYAVRTHETAAGVGDIMAHVTPMSHVAAFDLIGHSWAGVAHMPFAKWDPERFLDRTERERISMSMMVPTMISMLNEAVESGQAGRDLSSLKTITYGGSPVTDALVERSLANFGSIFVQIYGSTESPSLLTWLLKKEHYLGNPRLRSCGIAAPYVEVAILDEDNQELPYGEIGEVCIKSPTLLVEYINNPEATSEALRGGWYHSGDLAVMDEDGYVYLRDRKRDMIISGGFNVYPAEVENAIMGHPDVLECMVVGIQDEKWGETISAMVRVPHGKSITLDDIWAHTGATLGSYKRPRRLIVTEEPLPTSNVGKPLRRTVREIFEKRDSE